jgi:ferredoxin
VANSKKRVPENAPGDFFVDSTCIDCDTCRQIAPQVFGEAVGTSFVKAQPTGGADRRVALRAVLACPTGSIGDSSFESLYAGQPRWEIGRPQKAILGLADRITGSVLDSGCGTGENALFFAGRGQRVVQRQHGGGGPSPNHPDRQRSSRRSPDFPLSASLLGR